MLVKSFRAGALSDPDAPAFRYRDLPVTTRGELDHQVRSLAAWLQREGAAGQRVLLAMPPGPGMFVGLLACFYAGATAVPSRPERSDVVGRLADAAFVLSDLSESASPSLWVPHSHDSDDVVLLQCPSGSTESAKAVVVTAGAMLAQLESFRELVGLEPDFTVVNWAPIDGTLGMELMLLAQFVGCPATWLAPEDVSAHPYRWLRAVSDACTPVLSGGPTFAYDLCVDRITPAERASLDLRRWHTALIGAERVRPSTVELFVDTFKPYGLRPSALMSCYGLTEVMQGIAAVRNPSVVVADGHAWIPVGSPAPDATIVVVDPKTRRRCPDGVVGELWISGPMVCRGYWRDPVRSAEVFEARLASGEGPFLRTGDLGFTSKRGLVVCGRLKEIVIVRGRNFHPEDIEQVSQREVGRPLPAAAFSVDDPHGERLVVVQAVESASPELAEWIRRAVIAAFGVDVHEVVLVGPEAVPRTATGKIRRVACREAYVDGRLAAVGGAVAPPPVREVENFMPIREMVAGLSFELRSPVVTSEVRRRVGELLNNPGSLPGDTPLMLLGLESVRMIALRHGLEEDFGVSLPIADFVVLSIDDVAGVIVKQLA